VLKESMRLHPVIPMVTRVLKSPQRVAGYELPAGVTVAPSILLAHASEDSYPDHESSGRSGSLTTSPRRTRGSPSVAAFDGAWAPGSR
jgi:hypothetical protein